MRVSDVPTFGVGLIGYAFMGKAHSHALKTVPYILWPPAARTDLISICGRDEAAVREARDRYGYRRFTTDWRELVEDPEVTLVDNSTPNNLHLDPCLEAAKRGKPILCEKPLGRSAEESKAMLDAAEAAGVTHMCGFNYRFIPALQLARRLIQEGRLGEIFHFRASYQQGGRVDPNSPMTWRFRGDVAGSGALGDLGSHSLDQARWLVGEIGSVSGVTKTFIPDRPMAPDSSEREVVSVDDAYVAVIEFESGAIGTMEATRCAPGRKNYHIIEVNGSRGSLHFNCERLNELRFFSLDDPADVQGFHDVMVTENHHPYGRFWWPAGHALGWDATFTHEMYHLLNALAGNDTVEPLGATFLDGYRNSVIVDGLVESNRTGRKVYLDYAA